MKVLVIGHSMVHLRQQWFFQQLGKLCGECVIVGPKKWNHLSMQDSAQKNFGQIALDVYNEGDIFEYTLEGLMEVMHEIKPDIIYCQSEFRARQTEQVIICAKTLNISVVVFIWENIFSPGTEMERWAISNCDHIICGNIEAKLLVLPEESRGKCSVLPQVGIATELFKPIPLGAGGKRYNVVFCGRAVEEKGINIIKAGCEKLGYSLKIISGSEYGEIPRQLCEGQVFVSLPMTTPTWKEQSGSYANLEAMACGLPVITTRCGAIPEYLQDSVLYCKENDLEDFVSILKKLSEDVILYRHQRELALKKAAEYDNEKIAKQLKTILRRCLKY